MRTRKKPCFNLLKSDLHAANGLERQPVNECNTKRRRGIENVPGEVEIVRAQVDNRIEIKGGGGLLDLLRWKEVANLTSHDSNRYNVLCLFFRLKRVI